MAGRLALLLGAVVVSLFAITRGEPWIDDPKIIQTRVAEALSHDLCPQMSADLAAVEVSLPRVERVAAENLIIERLIAGVENLGQRTLSADRPTSEWLSDWQYLVTYRSSFVKADRADGTPRLPPHPKTGGESIIERMDQAAPAGCTVPPEILDDFRGR